MRGAPHGRAAGTEDITATRPNRLPRCQPNTPPTTGTVQETHHERSTHPPTPATRDDPSPPRSASGLHREEPTPPVNGPPNPTHPLSPKPLTPHQHEVVQAVAEQRIHRDILLGTLEPHLLDGKDAAWTLRALVIRGLVQLQPIGPPRLTTRGHRTLGSPTDVQIAGFDDIPTLRDHHPGLSTVRLPMHAMGERAVELALDSEANKPIIVRVPGKVVLRESTGLPQVNSEQPSS